MAHLLYPVLQELSTQIRVGRVYQTVYLAAPVLLLLWLVRSYIQHVRCALLGHILLEEQHRAQIVRGVNIQLLRLPKVQKFV
jgi:hypothetical protein